VHFGETIYEQGMWIKVAHNRVQLWALLFLVLVLETSGPLVCIFLYLTRTVFL